MNKLFFSCLLSILIVCCQSTSWVFANESTLTVITYHEAEIPMNLSNNRVDGLISEFRDKLPIELQTAIQNISGVHDKIRFLERSNLIELKIALQYENVAALVDTLLELVPCKANAFLFTKIEKGGGTIVFRSKIVDTKTVILAESRVEFKQQYSSVPDTLNYQVQQLARSIIKILFPPTIEYKNRLIDLDYRPFVNFPILSSGTVTLCSFIWYLNERNNVKSYHSKYEKATDIIDVTDLRIKTEKSLTRRNIARTTAVISGTIFGTLLVRDILWINKLNQDESHTMSNEKNRNKNRISINPSIIQENIGLTLQMFF
jgi:hypothetical protein